MEKKKSMLPTPEDGGESLKNFNGRQNSQVYKLKGLNKPWKAGGFNSIYATVEYGKEDWFHSGFDEAMFTDDRLLALFNMFNNTEENLWHDKNHKVRVECEGYSSSGAPMKPIIKELFLDI